MLKKKLNVRQIQEALEDYDKFEFTKLSYNYLNDFRIEEVDQITASLDIQGLGHQAETSKWDKSVLEEMSNRVNNAASLLSLRKDETLDTEDHHLLLQETPTIRGYVAPQISNRQEPYNSRFLKLSDWTKNDSLDATQVLMDDWVLGLNPKLCTWSLLDNRSKKQSMYSQESEYYTQRPNNLQTPMRSQLLPSQSSDRLLKLMDSQMSNLSLSYPDHHTPVTQSSNPFTSRNTPNTQKKKTRKSGF